MGIGRIRSEKLKEQVYKKEYAIAIDSKITEHEGVSMSRKIVSG